MTQRYRLVDYDQAPADVRAIYDDFLRSTGSTTLPVWVRSLGCSATLLQAYWERTKGSLLRGRLPAILKELTIFVVSVENGSRYCSAYHAHAALSRGGTLRFEQLASLTRPGDDSAGLPSPYRAALDFAIAAARNANAIPDAAFEQLQEADFSDDEIHELLSVIDLAIMFNSYTSAMQLPLDPEYRAVLAPL